MENWKACTTCKTELPFACYPLRKDKFRPVCSLCEMKGKVAREIARGEMARWHMVRSSQKRQVMIVAYALDPGIPECACGCGQTTNFHTAGEPNVFFPPHAKDKNGRWCNRCLDYKPWSEYRKENSSGSAKSVCRECLNLSWKEKRADPINGAEARARGKRNNDALVERQKAAYLEIHDAMPLCKCGCGENVSWTHNGEGGKPNDYVYAHHLHDGRDWSAFVSAWQAEKRIRNRDILREDLYPAIRKLKEAKGLSWKQVDDAIGQPCFHFTVRQDRIKAFRRVDVERMFRTLAGMPAVADPEVTERQAKEAAGHDKSINKARVYDLERKLKV